jgi:hypothetical protein
LYPPFFVILWAAFGAAAQRVLRRAKKGSMGTLHSEKTQKWAFAGLNWFQKILRVVFFSINSVTRIYMKHFIVD